MFVSLRKKKPTKKKGRDPLADKKREPDFVFTMGGPDGTETEASRGEKEREKRDKPREPERKDASEGSGGRFNNPEFQQHVRDTVARAKAKADKERYEAEMSGSWPAWWGTGGRELGIPRTGMCVARRKLLQLKVLLARMVLNRGDTLAIRCLAMCEHIRPAYREMLYGGTIFFSHCFLCGSPWSAPTCVPCTRRSIVKRVRVPAVHACARS